MYLQRSLADRANRPCRVQRPCCRDIAGCAGSQRLESQRASSARWRPTTWWAANSWLTVGWRSDRREPGVQALPANDGNYHGHCQSHCQSQSQSVMDHTHHWAASPPEQTTTHTQSINASILDYIIRSSCHFFFRYSLPIEWIYVPPNLIENAYWFRFMAFSTPFGT